MEQKNNIFSRIVNHTVFHKSIIAVILVSAALVGLETYANIYNAHQETFHIIDTVIQVIFSVEIIMRILAYGNRPLEFFKSKTNVTDFLITAVFYVPFGGTYASIFRLVRILRIFRLFTALPRLQLLVGALIKSVPSMGYISLLLLIQMYMFAVVGHVLFGSTDPQHFGDLGTAIMTLFQIITLEGWVDIMKAQQSPFAPVYFISFILLGTMVILNLFIGVILNGFDEVKKEIELEIDQHKKKQVAKNELAQISEQLEVLRKRLDVLIEGKK
jgi:voltage-gated sodium channel